MPFGNLDTYALVGVYRIIEVQVDGCVTLKPVFWIRIRIDLSVGLDLDPDPYWECGSGPGARKLTKINKYT
jgi:hypothetical protein